MAAELGPVSIDRVVSAAARSRDRLHRATHALGDAGLRFAVVGGHAVAGWVGRVDDSATRNCPDVDILIGAIDLDAAAGALAAAGFIRQPDVDIPTFLDGPAGRLRDAVRLHLTPDRPPSGRIDEGGPRPLLALPALVAMLLDRHRTVDRLGLRDLIDVGLVDGDWPDRYPEPLAARLRHLLDTPGG